MLHRLLIVLALLLVPSAAVAQDMEGTWDFRVEGTTIFRFEIAEAEDGEWHGQWQRPAQFNTDGDAFFNMGGAVRSSPSMAGISYRGMVELSFDDPRPGAIPDIFRFERTGPLSARMTYVGTELAPYALVLANDGDAIGNWERGQVYRRSQPATPAQEDLRVHGLDEVGSFDLSGGSAASADTSSADTPPAPAPEPAAQAAETRQEPAGADVPEAAAEPEVETAAPRPADDDGNGDWGEPDRITIGADFLDDL